MLRLHSNLYSAISRTTSGCRDLRTQAHNEKWNLRQNIFLHWRVADEKSFLRSFIFIFSCTTHTTHGLLVFQTNSVLFCKMISLNQLTAPFHPNSSPTTIFPPPQIYSYRTPSNLLRTPMRVCFQNFEDFSIQTVFLQSGCCSCEKFRFSFVLLFFVCDLLSIQIFWMCFVFVAVVLMFEISLNFQNLINPLYFCCGL